MRLWNKATAEPWAITSAALTAILEIAAKQNAPPEAVAAKLGRELQNSYRLEIRDGIAVLPVVGPLFRYANLFTQVSGASSYELLAKDFTHALKNSDIQAIVLNIDSPGGEVNGCAEFADMIHEARGIKPIIAYASGDAASGAYWIAAAADEIVVSKTSALGSIGVVGVYRGNKGDDAVEVVSSQSPYKRLDPDTDDGRARLQQRIDAMATVFVEAVAKYRNVSASHVQNHYGSGDVLIGEAAVRQGLADRIGSFEKLLQEINAQFVEEPLHSINANPKETSMADIKSLREAYPDLTASLEHDVRQNATMDERSRVQAILSDEAAKARTELAQYLAFETDMSVSAAVSLLAKAPCETASRDGVSGFNAAMAAIPNPEISACLEDEDDDAESVAKRLAAY